IPLESPHANALRLPARTLHRLPSRDFTPLERRAPMFIHHLESTFKQFGLPSERPRLILILPLVATLTADGQLNRFEKLAIEDFARDTLDFNTRQMRFLSSSLDSPHSDALVRDAFSLIEELMQIPAVARADTRTFARVLVPGERLLRLREIDRAPTSGRGRLRLEGLRERLDLVLGVATQGALPSAGWRATAAPT